MSTSRYTGKKTSSSIFIQPEAHIIWKHITQVQIAQFDDPWYFRLLDIPNTHKRQSYTSRARWSPDSVFCWHKKIHPNNFSMVKTYAFTFEPEPNFRVGWLFDLSDGPLR